MSRANRVFLVAIVAYIAAIVAIAALIILSTSANSQERIPTAEWSATVEIRNLIGAGFGSGMFISPTKILTAKHVVVSPIQEQMLKITDAAGNSIYTNTVFKHPTLDLAVITVGVPTDTPALYPTLDCTPLDIGDRVRGIGKYKSSIWVEIAGTVAAPIWQRKQPVSANYHHGMSGGPVLDEDGHIRGVIVGYLTVSERVPLSTGISLVTPLSLDCNLVNSLQKGKNDD